MAPTFYHYWLVPMDDQLKEDSRRRWCLWLLVGSLVVLVVGLIIALSIFVVRNNSEACQRGLELDRKCHNTTQFLNKQLTQGKKEILAAKTRADTCNQTVVKLKSQEQEKDEQIQKLKENITRLNQELQKTLTQLTQLRKNNTATNPASSQATSFLQLPMSLLLLSLSILLV